MKKLKDFNIHKDLINGCLRGDRLAQSEIYKLYYQAMYNTCYRIINNRVEAEDVMQEAFLSAFQKLRTFSNEMSFGSWLKKIVINKSIDFLRAKKIRFEELNEKSEYLDEPEVDFFNNADEDDARLVEKIKEAVKELPEGFRIVLLLSLFEGYDHGEIAMILNISESTSRSQLARAKQKLVEYLNKKLK
jgi:RNA polymerase sigma factor (sigma-70 family)